MSPLRRAARIAGALAPPPAIATTSGTARSCSALMAMNRPGNPAARSSEPPASSKVEQTSATAPAASSSRASSSGSAARTVDPLAVHAPMPTTALVSRSNMSMVLCTCGSRRSAAAISGLSTSIGTGSGYTAPPAHSATLRTSSIELTSSSRVGTLPTSCTTVQPGSRDRCPTIEWSVRPHEIPRMSSASSVSVSSSAQVRPSCSRLNSSGPSINRTTSVLLKP